MSTKTGVLIGAVLSVVIAVVILFLVAANRLSIRGAVVTGNADSTKELPIGDVRITVIGDPADGGVRSDASGFFSIPWRMRRGLRVMLHFEHPEYQPLDLPDVSGDRLYIAHLIPQVTAHIPEVTIANVVVKYTTNATTAINIGSALKTFQVINTGNVPCRGFRPCSPDGKWKAAVGSASIDAGPGNEFHNSRASCIAGPCPFTKIENSGLQLSRDGRTLHVSALNWSDTATFLLEAEVYQSMASDVLRQSYPVVFDRDLTFTLPAAAQGVSIQAELNGTTIIFPLGPTLLLSWANCQLLVNKDQTRVYRCELKPGYRFS